MPVYNEGANIARALAEIDAQVPLSKRVLVVYDSPSNHRITEDGAVIADVLLLPPRAGAAGDSRLGT